MSVEVIDKIKPKNGGNFKIVDSVDIEMPDGSSLQEVIKYLTDNVEDIHKVNSILANITIWKK